MRFKDTNAPLKSVKEVTETLFKASEEIRNGITEDDGPNQVVLPSGALLEGEGADLYRATLEAMAALLDNAVYHLERVSDV